LLLIPVIVGILVIDTVIVGLHGLIIITRLRILDPSYLIINILLKNVIIITVNNSISYRLRK